MAATLYTTADVAEKLNTTPRTLRKFLRADLPKDAQPGKGSRYTIEAKQVAPMRKRSAAWEAAQAEARAKKAEAHAEDIQHDAGVAAKEHLEDMGEDREPTAEEIEAMAELMIDNIDD